MFRTTALVLALGAMGMAGAASAQTTFEARFDHNPQVSAEENYASFERTARKACAVSVKEAGGVLNKARQERACTAGLMTDAVKATNDAALSSLHAQRTGVPTTAVASRD